MLALAADSSDWSLSLRPSARHSSRINSLPKKMDRNNELINVLK